LSIEGFSKNILTGKKNIRTKQTIDLKICSVREARKETRRFCFEIISPTINHVYQATSAVEQTEWIQAIQNSILESLNDTPMCFPCESNLAQAESCLSDQVGRSIGSSDDPNNGRFFLERLYAIDSTNRVCAECSNVNPEWCSVNLGVLMCIECSGAHRSLGTHVSKVKSVLLDAPSFTLSIKEFLLNTGNKVSNDKWESILATSTFFRKPKPCDSRDYKYRFIHAKYVDCLFC